MQLRCLYFHHCLILFIFPFSIISLSLSLSLSRLNPLRLKLHPSFSSQAYTSLLQAMLRTATLLLLTMVIAADETKRSTVVTLPQCSYAYSRCPMSLSTPADHPAEAKASKFDVEKHQHQEACDYSHSMRGMQPLSLWTIE